MLSSSERMQQRSILEGIHRALDEGEKVKATESSARLEVAHPSIPKEELPTVWDFYATAALQGILAGRKRDTPWEADALLKQVKLIADKAMETRPT